MILKGEMSYKKVFESTLFKKTLDMGDFSLNGDSLNTLYITKLKQFSEKLRQP